MLLVANIVEAILDYRKGPDVTLERFTKAFPMDGIDQIKHNNIISIKHDN